MTAQRGDLDAPPPAAEPPQDDTGRRECCKPGALTCRKWRHCDRFAPAASAAGAVDEEGLREALTDWLWSRLSIGGDAAREEAHALLAGPLAPVLAELRDTRAKVERGLRMADAWERVAQPGTAAGRIAAVRAALRSPATHTTSEEGR